MQKPDPGIYRHFKGGLYRVIGTGLIEHSEEPAVIYEALYDNPRSRLWIRRLDSFLETVEVNGEAQPRFARVEP